MRKAIRLLLVLVWLGACQEKSPEVEAVEKQIMVVSHPNIHTAHIIELFVWPGEYPTRPIVLEAQQHFEPFREHPAITFSDSLLQNEVFYFDELVEILLYLEDLPSTHFKYPLANSPYAAQEELIKEWVAQLSAFYTDARVAYFLSKHARFYEGSKQEVLANLPPDDFVNHIESYYRAKKLSYTVIPAPEMPTGGAYGYRGIGPYVYTPEGMHIYQIISASLPVVKDSISSQFDAFGFDNPEFVLRNSYHEFGHSFVNTVLSKGPYDSLLQTYAHLFTPELKALMTQQNYGTWFDCMAEHLVRLGEIRLAERSGNHVWAEELRAYHYKELRFIFLPELEQQIIAYEQDASIDSFEAYLPTLLQVLDGFDSADIEIRIGQAALGYDPHQK